MVIINTEPIGPQATNEGAGFNDGMFMRECMAAVYEVDWIGSILYNLYKMFYKQLGIRDILTTVNGSHGGIVKV